MKNFRPRSFTRGHAALVIVLSLTFLVLFSISRISAQQDPPPQDPPPPPVEEGRHVPARMRSEAIFGEFDYEAFLERIRNGDINEDQSGDVEGDSPLNSLTNNNAGATATGFFTQSETTIVAFGATVVVGFNDSGSNSGGTNKFTGFARSTNGGATFTDGGALPTNPGGDAGDPVMARNNTTGRIYFATLGFSVSTIQVFRSDDDGATWMLPVNGTPGGSSEDKEWITVDNFAGPGNGNVYLLSRRFGGTGGGPGIYLFRSTDNGATFGPTNGTQITPGAQGAFVAVGPDHSIYAFWYAGATIQMRKSTNQGLTFGPPVTVASGLVGGVNGDLGLTGIRQGLATPAGFRRRPSTPSTGTSTSPSPIIPPPWIKLIFSSCNPLTEAPPGGPTSESTTTRPRQTSGNRRWRSLRTAQILASSTTAVRKTLSETTCSSFMGAPPLSQAQR